MDDEQLLLRDPEVRAIIAHDGGQTALGYLDLIDFAAVTADPKPILGYSDISLLHLVLYARTVLVGFHADLATPGLGGHWQAAPAARRAELEKLYSTLLTGTEPIGRASYVWSCLQVLRHCGILDRISGMVVGVPHAIEGLDSPDASPTLPEIVLDVLGDRDIPVLGMDQVPAKSWEGQAAGASVPRPPDAIS
ncbi:LD-carboxypeptidase [Streptomyces sp. NPDC004270]